MGALCLALVVGLLSPDLFDSFVNLVVVQDELLVSGLELSDVSDLVVDFKQFIFQLRQLQSLRALRGRL